MYFQIASVEYALSVFNSFDKNIKFTYEEEQNNTLPFSDVLLIGDLKPQHHCRKDANNDARVYIVTHLHQSVESEGH